MRNKYKFLAVAFAGLLMASCASNTEEVTQEEVQTEQACVYSFNRDETEISFTAYKFLNRTGVGGAFDEFLIEGEESEDIFELIQSLKYEILVSGLDTKDPSRDGKITEFFFDEINTEFIYGKVVSLDDEGNATIEITMNDITNNVDGKYTLEGEHFSFEAEIDVLDWDAQAGIDALNEE
ncbi:MAG TPA: YceI family protein, partial [Brumimicrobium sp.]|nr:YceI family protein [Brumimicrobium sp.]